MLIRRVKETTKLGVVVHGVLSVGKSTLARALAVHLASTDAIVILRNVKSKNVEDRKDAAISLGKLANLKKWVLIDECDMGMFHYPSILHHLTNHRGNFGTPVIFFTSGHFPPDPKVIKETAFDVMVIDIQVDHDYIHSISPSLEEEKVQEVLDITKHLGLARTLIEELSFGDLSKEEMIDHLYGTHMLRIGNNKDGIFCILSSYSNRDGLLKYLSVDALTALAFVQRNSGVADTRGKGVNSIIDMNNVVRITSDGEAEELTKKFTLMGPEEYFYSIRYPAKVGQFLNEYENSTKKCRFYLIS